MKSCLSIEGKCCDHFFVSEKVEGVFDLLGWLASSSLYPKFYLKRSDKEVAASGSLMTLGSAPKFERKNSSPMRFFGGQSFFPDTPYKDAVWQAFPQRQFFAPEFEMIKERGRVTRYAHSLEKEPVLPELEAAKSFLGLGSLPSPRHFPEEGQWVEIVRALLGEIEQERLDKVVMARRSEFEVAGCDPFALASALKQGHSTASIFLVQFAPGSAFVGATPESLFWREGGRLHSEAIAGTRPRGKDAVSDLALEQELMGSKKEQHEFAFVKRSIEKSLGFLLTSFDWMGASSVLKTQVVQHLHHRLEGALRMDTTDQQLIDALHPTAAMGGAPRTDALDYLKAHEPFERGWYASPLGFTSQKWAEFVVGIRSALVGEKGLHLFAGAGIVSGSDPLSEWGELNHKTQTVRRLLK
jgi:menaquinone-specific isochorismate synthase